MLISAGGNIDARDVLGRTPLMLASEEYSPDTVKVLIANGANVKARIEGGSTALMWASSTYHKMEGENKKQLETIKILLAAGADVMARNGDRSTPLHFAWSVDKAKILLQAGAEINAKDNRYNTPLHIAAKFEIAVGQEGLIQLFLDAGADPHAKNRKGQKPWDQTEENPALKELKKTKGYWALNEAQYK